MSTKTYLFQNNSLLLLGLNNFSIKLDGVETLKVQTTISDLCSTERYPSLIIAFIVDLYVYKSKKYNGFMLKIKRT